MTDKRGRSRWPDNCERYSASGRAIVRVALGEVTLEIRGELPGRGLR